MAISDTLPTLVTMEVRKFNKNDAFTNANSYARAAGKCLKSNVEITHVSCGQTFVPCLTQSLNIIGKVTLIMSQHSYKTVIPTKEERRKRSGLVTNASDALDRA